MAGAWIRFLAGVARGSGWKAVSVPRSPCLDCSRPDSFWTLERIQALWALNDGFVERRDVVLRSLEWYAYTGFETDSDSDTWVPGDMIR